MRMRHIKNQNNIMHEAYFADSRAFLLIKISRLFTWFVVVVAHNEGVCMGYNIVSKTTRFTQLTIKYTPDIVSTLLNIHHRYLVATLSLFQDSLLSESLV